MNEKLKVLVSNVLFISFLCFLVYFGLKVFINTWSSRFNYRQDRKELLEILKDHEARIKHLEIQQENIILYEAYDVPSEKE